MTTNFFESQKDQSKIKTEILTKYFYAWSKIMRARSNKIAYIDLFSGPGKYEDGQPSTPLIILEKTIQDEELLSSLVTVFNDANGEHAKELRKNILELDGIEKFHFKPTVLNDEVGYKLAELFEGKNLIPTLAFIDPWGYKGLTSRLINALIKDYGSDCIFFFNYNRINMGINNSKVIEHMNNLFGEERANQMRQIIKSFSPEEKELYIVDALAESLSDKRKNLVLPFRFLDEDKNKTSHYLIFVSKHELGYSIMKDIMARESTLREDEVASFSYIPVKHIHKHSNLQLNLLQMYERPLDSLGQEIIQIFAGKQLSMLDIYQKHHIGTPYTKSNYKEALLRLEESDKIITDPPRDRRRKRGGKPTFGDKVKVTIPM